VKIWLENSLRIAVKIWLGKAEKTWLKKGSEDGSEASGSSSTGWLDGAEGRDLF